MYCNILVTKPFDHTFTYKIKSDQKVKVGSIVSVSFGKKITNLEPGTWLIILCAISEQEDIVNLKDNSFYKNKYDEFKDKEWKQVIANFYFPPDSSVHKKLEEFSTKVFPPLKLVESVSA